MGPDEIVRLSIGDQQIQWWLERAQLIARIRELEAEVEKLKPAEALAELERLGREAGDATGIISHSNDS